MTALSWVRSRPSDQAVRWKALEVAAFAAYPRVVRQLDPRGRYRSAADTGKQSTTDRHGTAGQAAKALALVLAAIPVVLLMVLAFFPAIIGFALLVGDRFGRTHPDPHVSVPAAGIIFVFAFVVLGTDFVYWLRKRRERDGLRETQAVTAALFALLSVAPAARRIDEGQLAGYEWALVPMVATAALGVVYAILLLRAGRAARRDRLRASSRGEKTFASTGGTPGVPLAPVRAAISKLTQAQRDAVRADLDEAIVALRDQGAISAQDAAWASRADLGMLAYHMAQPRPATHEPAAPAQPTASSPPETE